MSVDVDATIVIGWILEDSKVDHDVFEMWNDDEKTDEIKAIIGDDYASDWVGYTNNYSCESTRPYAENRQRPNRSSSYSRGGGDELFSFIYWAI